MNRTNQLLFVFIFISLHAKAQVLTPKNIEKHPYLASTSAIHVDLFNSGTTDNTAPGLEGDIKVQRINYGKARLGLNVCLNYLYGEDGTLYGFCGSPRAGYMKGIEFHLAIFDPKTMKKIDKYTFFEIELMNVIKNKLPLNLGYFVLDSKGRVLVTTSEGDILFLKKNSDNKIILEEKISLPDHIKERGQLSQVIPDYEGNYWFFMPGDREKKKSAQVGLLEKESGRYHILELNNELIENGMALDKSGLYIVSDRAFYKFHFEDGNIKLSMKEEYARASTVKPGTISLEGSGTTPTILGKTNDLVAIVDNADDQVNLIVYDKAEFSIRENRRVCEVPLFEKGKSAVENSVVGYHDSIIVQNWYNSPSFLGSQKEMEPGIWRIDVRPDRSGCDIVWKNDTSFGTGTLKLSTYTGLLYLPTQNRTRLPREKTFVEFIDFKTGEVKKKVYIGRGLASRTIMSPIYIGPEGKLLQPIFSGVVSLEEKKD